MGKDYLYFEVEDFIADEFFHEWVKSPSPKANAFWEAWLSEHPHKKEVAMKAAAFLHHLSIKPIKPSTSQVERSLQKSLEVIAQQEQSLTLASGAKKKKTHAFLLMAAAITCIVAGIGAWQMFFSAPVTIEVVTGNNEIRNIVLPDSSRITLNANSSLTYAANINTNKVRQVTLDGEAFFDVKHIEDDSKPRKFIVRSPDLEIEVLGTTFNVKKRRDTYNVSLNTGSIRIRLNNGNAPPILLKPGDFFQYAKSKRVILRKKVKPELYSDWKEEKMELHNFSLKEMAALIHDLYGYNIVMKQEELGDEQISGTILLKDEQTLLQTLSYALNIDIIKKDSTLIFEIKNKK